ncbi:hypothetical protein L2E82_05112 [Cichorium intybus]|uniref:Uncharacterized protein n=1 Tax=Cichorium intybus TaxID=13427 RepID=A0ACB9H747_CICIN|nr:hypothetical protein L2E82_05112 [Cichorium intybus]
MWSQNLISWTTSLLILLVPDYGDGSLLFFSSDGWQVLNRSEGTRQRKLPIKHKSGKNCSKLDRKMYP